MENNYSLFQIEKNSDVLISFKLENQKFEFPTKIIDNENKLILKALKFNEGILNLETNKTNINIIYLKKDSRPIIFKNCDIKMDKYQKEPVYNIASDVLGKEYNRRDSVRIFVGASGSMNYEGHPNSININVKNISQSGISFVSEEKIDCLNKKIFINFFDPSFGSLKLRAQVVRENILENGKHVYGCTLAKEYTIVKEFIMQKQIKQLKK